jgi:hypothetical protein
MKRMHVSWPPNRTYADPLEFDYDDRNLFPYLPEPSDEEVEDLVIVLFIPSLLTCLKRNKGKEKETEPNGQAEAEDDEDEDEESVIILFILL